MRKHSKDDEPRMQRSAADFMRDFFNVGKVKRVFRMGTDLVGAVSPFIEKRTPLSAAQAAFNIGKIIVDDLEMWPDDYFDESWEVPYPVDFNKIVLGALANKPYKVLRTSDESTVIHIVQLEDVKFGYTLNMKTSFIEKLYVEADKLDRARDLIKSELWKNMKDDNIVLRHVRRPRANDYDSNSVSLEVDDAFRPMPSKRAAEYAAYLKKCTDAGVSRSVLLYGPPGTGKSTMARTIVSSLGMKSFRIRVEDIGHLETSTIFEAINIFEPDAVILDDFDRSGEQAALLETLEFFQRHVKLVIATVNNKRLLDEAILRPGRFDELLQIKQMDGDVVSAVLGEDHSDAFELVKDWPIAFIQEYVKRRRFMSAEEATDSVKELAARVKRLNKYDDDDENAAIDKIFETSDKKSKNILTSFDDYANAIKAGKRKRRRTSV